MAAAPPTFRRHSWAICLVAIIATGILSRFFHTGWILLDKYLGDALYAMMIYVLLRLFSIPAARAALLASLLMLAIESFQLTGIPARLLTSEQLPVRLLARLLGVQFSFLDLLAYASGIACLYLWDSRHRPAHLAS